MNAEVELGQEPTWTETAAALLKAVAHPMRLSILQALAQEECCVCHLVCLLQKRQPYISQQLMALREAGLVIDRRDGTAVYYRLADPAVRQLLALAREMSGADAGEELPRAPMSGCTCPKCASAALVRPWADGQAWRAQ